MYIARKLTGVGGNQTQYGVLCTYCLKRTFFYDRWREWVAYRRMSDKVSARTVLWYDIKIPHKDFEGGFNWVEKEKDIQGLVPPPWTIGS
jgi:hypothetical protein